MIFRTSVSDEKHGVNLLRHSQLSASDTSHNDDITLLEDQEQHLEAQPSLTGKYVNKTARSWVEARVDWRVQYFGALMVYIVVVLIAYFTSYRDKYNSIIVTTSNAALEFPGGVQGPSAITLPQILLLAETSPFPQQTFQTARIGITRNLNTATAGNVTWCNFTSGGPQALSVGPYSSYLVGFKNCTLSCASHSP